MKLLWTKSSSPLSKLIRLMTGDDCSHFSLVLYDGKPGEIMFESNLLGTHPAFVLTTMKSHEVVHEITIPLEQAIEDGIWDNVVKIYDGKPYDFLGALYLGLCKLGARIFKSTVPEINKWSRPNAYFCDEIYSSLEGIAGLPEIPICNGMKTPHDVWEYFK